MCAWTRKRRVVVVIVIIAIMASHRAATVAAAAVESNSHTRARVHVTQSAQRHAGSVTLRFLFPSTFHPNSPVFLCRRGFCDRTSSD